MAASDSRVARVENARPASCLDLAPPPFSFAPLPPTLVTMSNAEGTLQPQEGSKFKRFLKRFGRRPSDEHRKGGQAEGEGLDGEEGNASEDTQPGLVPAEGGAKKAGSMRSRKGSKTGTNGTSAKGKKGDSLGGRFFNAPPLPSSPQQRDGLHVKTGPTSPALPISPTEGFGGTSGEGLANTLTIPPSTSPAPQLDGLPAHEPIAANDLMPIGSKPDPNGNIDGSSMTAGVERSPAMSGSPRGGADLTHQSSFGSSRRGPSSSDLDSTTGGIRGRDSLDNRTMDTGKSRASTKPTTLMSLETPENAQGSYTPMAQIAQHRHGDGPNRLSSTRNQTSSESYGTSVQFAPPAPLGRTISGTIVQLPGNVEEVPYVNIPSVSRPHPSNNPHPTGIPADNASMLTLASSTAAASITGGAASSRGHSYATPSLGGARSIGGSLMGERRNSSDTYASVKALPPLSRRGSDSSSRTGKSVAASATGRSSAQAMVTPGSAAFVTAGPGAPSDRIR